ncbi:MAG: hypothetical protein KKE39_14405, partial [Bacteroidetes bacterium]|nr:hypothetical protein [Bacteroidota bacterium]MBU1760191.1 hypothetical protein [Bacteroidota bacterium]
MISKKNEQLNWILTYDLRGSQTYTFRYFSFLSKLLEKNNNTTAIGLISPLNTSHTEELSVNSCLVYTPHLLDLIIIDYNIIQKILLFIDKHHY